MPQETLIPKLKSEKRSCPKIREIKKTLESHITDSEILKKVATRITPLITPTPNQHGLLKYRCVSCGKKVELSIFPATTTSQREYLSVFFNSKICFTCFSKNRKGIS